MGETHGEKPAIVLTEFPLLPVVIHGIAGAFFEQKHRQTGRQEFGLVILGRFLADVLNVAQSLKKIREVLMNGMHNLEDDVGLLQFPKTGKFFSVGPLLAFFEPFLLLSCRDGAVSSWWPPGKD